MTTRIRDRLRPHLNDYFTITFSISSYCIALCTIPSAVLGVRVWHPPKSGKARRHSSLSLSQSINIRLSLIFHLFFSSSLFLSPGFFVGSSISSYDSSLEPQPTSGRGLTFAMVNSIGPISTPPTWPRLVPRGSAYGLSHLMARTDRCPSRPLSVPSRAILYPRSSRFPLSALSSFLPTVGLLLLALSAQQLFYTRFWVIAIATTRARVWRSLPRTTACAPRPIE